MKAVEPPDSFHIQAARSLLEEGNYAAARDELGQIASGARLHPDVLEVRWGIEAQTGDWPLCLEIAQTLITVVPERPSGWIKRSYVLHRLKRSQEALDGLFSVVEKFSKIAIIPYNLACYSAQLGCFWEAERWLKQALEIGGDDYRKMAARDRDLATLWKWMEGQSLARHQE